MDFLTFAYIYLSATAFLLFVLLFGENPLFVKTPIGYCRWLISSGLWEGLEWLVWKCCGDRGINVVNSVVECCCDRPNPTLQIFYVALLSGGYYAYWEFVFKLLERSPFASENHMLSGTAMACLCLALFIAASVSDPGTVTASNVEKHRALYAADGYIWQQVECWTCNFMRPARSKHCGVCGRCVARFDHHCAWINNCVGLNNTRIFFAFLVSNCSLCMYGSILAALVLYGELHKHGLMQLSTWDAKAGRLVSLRDQPHALVQWLLHYYPAACMLQLFLMVATLLLGGFFAYHFYLLLRGMTMYETFRSQRRQAEHMASLVPAGGPPAVQTSWSTRVWRMCCGRGGLRPPARPAPPNPYDQGVVRNLYEVFRPTAALEAAWKAAQKNKEH